MTLKLSGAESSVFCRDKSGVGVGLNYKQSAKNQ